ncbi:hypothetical protein ABZ341_41645 [Streptomyces sp. NPDC006173]|uniref:hypothetical protein n=1 Tax=Streptomyces sp. NPDC006173 TaxID=3155349 RepID=UPI0033C1F779
MPRELTLSVLALLALVGDFALVLTGHDVPPLLETLSTVTIGAAAGAAIPKAKAAV